jgi:hypothetical protein
MTPIQPVLVFCVCLSTALLVAGGIIYSDYPSYAGCDPNCADLECRQLCITIEHRIYARDLKRKGAVAMLVIGALLMVVAVVIKYDSGIDPNPRSRPLKVWFNLKRAS